MPSVWKGVFPALTTPFDEHLAVDHEALALHLERLIAAGIDGAVVGGSLGENGSLTEDEQLAVLETALGAAAGRIPVVAGVAEATPDAAGRVIRRAATTGAAGIMLLPPMRYRTDRRETLAYLGAVTRSSPLPVMIYNNPVAYGTDVTPEMFSELAGIAPITALKESSGDPRRITEIVARTGDRFQIFVGVDDLALEAFVLGATGWVAGLVCAFPEETIALYRLARAGRWDEARALYRWFTPLLKLDTSTKFVHYIKLAQELTGLGSARVRPPRLALESAERMEIEQTVRGALSRRPEVEPLIRLGLQLSVLVAR